MSCKVVWDYAIYWSLLAFFFIQGQLTNISLLGRLEDFTRRIGDINAEMQGFFLRWHAEGVIPIHNRFINQAKIELLEQLNTELTSNLTSEDFEAQCHRNGERLSQLRDEIQAHAGMQCPDLDTPALSDTPLILDEIWQAVGLDRDQLPNANKRSAVRM